MSCDPTESGAPSVRSPMCAVEGCARTDVTDRIVQVDTTFRARARVPLCDEHGKMRPAAPACPEATTRSGSPFVIIPGFSRYELRAVTAVSQASVRSRRRRVADRAGWHILARRPVAGVLAAGRPNFQLVADETGAREVHQMGHYVLVAHGQPRPSPEHTVRHHDGDPMNNDIGNLAWKLHLHA